MGAKSCCSSSTPKADHRNITKKRQTQNNIKHRGEPRIMNNNETENTMENTMDSKTKLLLNPVNPYICQNLLTAQNEFNLQKNKEFELKHEILQKSAYKTSENVFLDHAKNKNKKQEQIKCGSNKNCNELKIPQTPHMHLVSGSKTTSLEYEDLDNIETEMMMYLKSLPGSERVRKVNTTNDQSWDTESAEIYETNLVKYEHDDNLQKEESLNLQKK
eukprot:310820_1